MRGLLLPLLVSFAAGCGGGEFDMANEDGAGTDAPTNTSTTDTDDTTVDTGPAAADPAWWALDAQLRVQADGQLDPALSLAQVTLYDETLAPLCAHDLPILGATVDDPPSAAVTFGWWRLELDDGVPDGPCAAWPARALRLGLGTYDPRLDPATHAGGWDPSTLLGLYLEEYAGAPLYVIGIAGTPRMLGGEDPAPTEPPLAEGRYDAHTLVLMAF